MTDAKFKVAAVQLLAGQIAGPVGDLARAEALTAEAARQGARLVVWPECSYPAYFLRSQAHYDACAATRIDFAALMERLAAVAAGNRLWLIAGVVEPRDDGQLANAAVVFDPAGQRRLVYRKSFLWHFDSLYFAPGDELPVIETELGRLGVMICADGRCPELAAMAGRQGVQLLVNPTAWVSWARQGEALTNPQIEYFIPARAIENGCWVLSANKVGVEADSIVYCGRSNLVSPAGETLAMLDSQAEGLLVAEVDLSACRPAVPPPQRDEPTTMESADAGQYPPILFKPPGYLPVRQTPMSLAGPDESLIVAAMAGPLAGFDPDRLIGDLEAQSVGLLIAGRCAEASCRDAWMQRAGRSGMMVAFADAAAPGRAVSRLQCSAGPVDSFSPARAAMLNGAELFIAHTAGEGVCPDLRLLRARAAENRIYLAAAADDRAVILAPTGQVLADSLAGRPMVVVARLVPAQARDKAMAPATDVVAGRNPAMYARVLGER